MYVLEVRTDQDQIIRKVFRAREDAQGLYDACISAMSRGRLVGRSNQRQLIEVVRLFRAEADSVEEAVAMVNAGSCEVLWDSEADAGKSLDELIEEAIAEARRATHMH